MVLIGVDPHKSSHTAVAIDDNEQPIAQLRVAADRRQLQRLLAWAEPFAPHRLKRHRVRRTVTGSTRAATGSSTTRCI